MTDSIISWPVVSDTTEKLIQGQNVGVCVCGGGGVEVNVIFFIIFFFFGGGVEILKIYSGIVVAMCDLVHHVKTKYNLHLLLAASENPFMHYECNFSEICVLHGKLQLAVSRASIIFQKRFPDAVSS